VQASRLLTIFPNADPMRRPLVDSGWISWNRRFAAWFGLVSLCALALIADGPATKWFANLAVAALGVATVIGFVEAALSHRIERAVRRRSSARRERWGVPVIVVALVTTIASQTWFRPGMAIAAGDVPPPNGIAWLSRLFVPWAWSGSDLGSPSALEQQLPWAIVLWAVHLLGGSGELAQRIWFALFFACASIACLVLTRTLGARPSAAAIGSLAYSFSPFVVANLIPNYVLLVAFALLPTLPAIVLLGAQGRVSIRTAAVLVAVSAPLLGFIYINPPTLGTVLAAILVSPLLAGWLYGAEAARRGFLILALGVPIMVLLSMYWIVPSILQLHNAGFAQLSSISNWSWTENRATLSNGLWLNTVWTWLHQEYVPFAQAYDDFPLSFFRFAPAIVAFGALTIRHKSPAGSDIHLGLRLTTAASGIALALIFLGTGTNPPGNVVFDRLYSLPFGWLLREPGRFLLVADLMFAVLVTITVQRLVQFDWLRGRLSESRRFKLRNVAGVPIALALMLPGLPLLTGAIVPDSRPSLPPMHVRMPNYWIEMAAFVDRMPVTGAMLVMPPDDFYQMPYQWGYYGSDAFIPQLMNRRVLIPSEQAYFPTSSQVLKVEDLAASSILAGNWEVEDRLLRALGTPLVLVRGDLDPTIPGRTFQSAGPLADSLEQASNFDLVHTAGPLRLYKLKGMTSAESAAAPYFATVSNTSPDLRVLSRMPDGAALISGAPRPGVPSLEELPPIDDWRVGSDQVTWDFVENPGLTYALIQLDSRSAAEPVGRLMGNSPSRSGIHVTRIPGPSGSTKIEVSVEARNRLINGDFHAGHWSPMRDCSNVSGPATGSLATIIPDGGPDGGPFLRLSSRQNSTCEYQQLNWHGGSVVLTLSLRHLSGASPRICIWETGPQRCAALPPPGHEEGRWMSYKAVVVPDTRTTDLSLFIYADGTDTTRQTQNDYANVQALEVTTLPQLDVLATPLLLSRSTRLEVHRSSYSPSWQGPSGSEHVLVDGFLNGWVVPAEQPFLPEYQPDSVVRAGFMVSTVAALSLCLALSFVLRRGRRPR
jgi:hypothetical protein